MSWGTGELPPPMESGNAISSGNIYILGSIQQPKIKKNVPIKWETEFVLSSEMKCPKSGFSLITGSGESGKQLWMKRHYLQLSFSSLTACYLVRLDEFFSGTVKIFLGQKWLRLLPHTKTGPYAYGEEQKIGSLCGCSNQIKSLRPTKYSDAYPLFNILPHNPPKNNNLLYLQDL